MQARRIFGLGLTILTMAASSQSHADGSGSVTVASAGGSYGNAQDKALFLDAAEATGIEIFRESGASMSKACLQVASGSVSWDLVIASSAGAAAAAKNGCLEEIDYAMVDTSDFLPGTFTDFCVGTDVFATLMAWNTEKYGEPGSETAPKSWADFFDVERFPGTRAYRADSVNGVLEPALMADGVPPEDVYRVLSTRQGKERAINKIRELKPHIEVFWSSGAMQAQLMKDNAVDMSTGWNGRFEAVKDAGGTVAYTFNDALLDYSCFAIPKGAPNKDAAMRLLAEISRPQYQARIPEYIPYGPTHKGAYDLMNLPQQRIEILPSYPENVTLMLPMDVEWYAEHRDEALEMYLEMLSE